VNQIPKVSAIAANQILHSSLASKYETDEPHFRPENRVKVMNRLSYIVQSINPCKTMVDFGCGTGFLEELAPASLTRIIGVDATEDMVNILRKKSLPNVEILIESVENTSLPDSVADVVTGYSVLDHFESTRAVFVEAARLLRPGGILYMDLIPNGDFWNELRNVSHNISEIDTIVSRELSEVAHHSSKMLDRYGIEPEVLAAAEPHKEIRDGFSLAELTQELTASGFGLVKIQREWFLGEASILHGSSESHAQIVSDHLRRLSPLTDHLFKYLWFTATKL
jgi:2-polyprenyl-3-methyl-5-hydroxy-6-metoxy-1,4-benzoquinol methylase